MKEEILVEPRDTLVEELRCFEVALGGVKRCEDLLRRAADRIEEIEAAARRVGEAWERANKGGALDALMKLLAACEVEHER